MISKRLIESSRKKLLDEKKRLEELMSRIAKQDSEGQNFHAAYPEFGSAADENASEVAAYETNIAEEWDLEQKMRKVLEALKRIDSGSYGTCKIGGEDMPEARLKAAPEAENCVEHEPS